MKKGDNEKKKNEMVTVTTTATVEHPVVNIGEAVALVAAIAAQVKVLAKAHK